LQEVAAAQLGSFVFVGHDFLQKEDEPIKL